MTQKLPVDCFEWKKPSKFTSDFIKNYDEKSSTSHVFDVDINYPKTLHDLHSDLPFLPQRMKVHKLISFNQEAWMKDYIITNIEEKNKQIVNLKKIFIS